MDWRQYKPAVILTVILFAQISCGRLLQKQDKDRIARNWLKDFIKGLTPLAVDATVAAWAQSTNITDENEKNSIDANLKFSNFSIRSSNYAYANFDPNDLKDPSLKRQIQMVIRGRSATNDSERLELEEMAAELARMYSTAKICPIENPHNCSESEMLSLAPDLRELMSKNRNETVLRYVWKEWREVTGPKMGGTFFKVIRDATDYTKRLGFNSLTERALISYTEDDPKFRKNIRNLFKEMLPLYEDLHAFTRYRLNKQYGSEIVELNTTIPAHLLGNMWAQSWSGIIDILRPFPNTTSANISVDDTMKSMNWTVTKMFVVAENFFTSLGMPPLRQEFWNYSMLEKPDDGREVVCHASAWDFNTQKDFRIKQCTLISRKHLGVVHHELGHIYYYKAYKDLPIIFRGGANPGFHEAVGDMIYLSSNTDRYLQEIGLLPSDYKPSREEKLNALMQKALDSIAFLPFGYLMDLWRWDVDEGKVNEKNANAHWWNLRGKYQGIHSPVARKPEHMDPMGKFHIPNFVRYIRYYVARFLQYQFHEAACKEDYPDIPTYKCSIFGSKKAGEKLWKILQLGESTPWPDVLEMMTGGRTMSAKPLLNYFEEIARWLRHTNKANKVCLGWGQKWPADYKLNEPRC